VALDRAVATSIAIALLAATAVADVIVGANAQLLIGASIGGAFLAGGAT
jgi:hypothetical protein